MRDKDWLAKVSLAAEHYKQSHQAAAETIESFIEWMYSLYGITSPNKGKKDENSKN